MGKGDSIHDYAPVYPQSALQYYFFSDTISSAEQYIISYRYHTDSMNNCSIDDSYISIRASSNLYTDTVFTSSFSCYGTSIDHNFYE